ncbi:MAG: hypothetical protein K2H92_10025 [Bacteroidaceae bacterium]|nr:hypothetical protein [Bacteroidaceae bacterium]
MSPTSVGRSRGHRFVGVGDSDLDALSVRLQPSANPANCRCSTPTTAKTFFLMSGLRLNKAVRVSCAQIHAKKCILG